MKSPEEQQVAFIPRNFIERGTIMGGTFKIRNVIEGGILAVGITIPVLHLPLSLTIRIIILCMTALPAAMVSLIGISGESLTAFLMNALRFLKNRRMIYRSDVIPDPAVKQRKKPRNKEPKAHKRKRRKQDTPSRKDKEETPEDTAQASLVPVSSVKKKERREFDVSTKHGIKKQAREDIRVLKFNLKEEKRYQKALHKAALQKEKQEKRRQKAEKKAVVRTEKTKGDSSAS